MRLDLLRELNAERTARRAVAVVTDLASGEQRLVRPGSMGDDPLATEIADAFRSGKSRIVEHDGAKLFIEANVPPAKLVITGAVHISQALAPMAQRLGYDVTIVDPRTAFATSERFPDVALLAEWPDTALPKLSLDPFTAFAALTHDPKIDEPALEAALGAGCFYVGALGSRKTHARRVDRLKSLGVSDEALGRIHAPIGLSIGAVSPEEIAVSVLAQITAVRRQAGAAR